MKTTNNLFVFLGSVMKFSDWLREWFPLPRIIQMLTSALIGAWTFYEITTDQPTDGGMRVQREIALKMTIINNFYFDA